MAGVEYRAAPRATATPFMPVVVALAAGTTKTVLQVAPVTADIQLLAWGVSYDGTVGSNTPVTAQLIDGDVAASVGTAFTPELWGNSLQQPSLAVGGAALTGYNFGTENAMTAVRELDSGFVHPQAGYATWWPEGARPRVAAGRFLRIRCNAAQIVDVLPFIIWAEPAV